MPDTVYTPEEIAEKLHVSSRAVYDLLRTGKIKSFKVGRLWRITDEAMEEYIAKGGARISPTKRVKTITYIH